MHQDLKPRWIPSCFLGAMLLLVSSLVWAANTVSPLAVDATQKGHPISPYIYGQFIEHLGRCIYGGIWAEMLEDRKFYYPVTDNYAPSKPDKNMPPDTAFPVIGASPWQVIGPAGSVTMIKEAPFVGEHTPQIAAGSGIQQHDLAVVQGKQYVGHVWLKARQAGTSATVSLTDSGEAPIVEVSQEFQKHEFRFTAQASSDKASLSIRIAGGPCLIGTVSLMPADNVEGLRADTLQVLKELNSPVYRWPGGNFVSGYDWKDGIGDRDRRPPRKNPAWTGVEHNDFGIHEFIAFCHLVKAEPLVVVNSGLGQMDNAVAELQYANSSPNTPMGRKRAVNGHHAPFGVKWWGIGNEMYGSWQLGHMPLEQYVRKHNEYASAMRAVDKSIKLVGVGDVGPWSEGMMQKCADYMDLVSEHFYCQKKDDLIAHVAQIPDRIRRKAEAHRDYRQRFESLKGKDIDIALDEWNYWYGPHVFGELGTRYFLKDGLGIAAGIHEYARQSDIMFMANYAQTVNVIGCIKTTRTAAALETTGLVLQLYRQHLGTIPVAVKAQAPLDVIAALTEDGKSLTIGVVNPTMDAHDLPLTIQGAEIAGKGTRWQIAGLDPLAYNDPGQPLRVKIEESAVDAAGQQVSVAPCSVTLFALPIKSAASSGSSVVEMEMTLPSLSAILKSLATDPFVVFEGQQGPGQGKHIVLVSGDEEYRSEEALPMLAQILAKHHGFKCTVLFAIEPKDGTITPTVLNNIPGLERLKDADMMVMFTRFRELPDDQMRHIIDFTNSGKPILGLRTATHAFNYKENPASPFAKFSFNSKDPAGGWGQLVLGETWVNHHGHHKVESTRGVINPQYADHPMLKGVDDIWGPTDVYTVTHLPAAAQVLVHGQVLEGMKPADKPLAGPKNDPMMPLVWTREYQGESGKASKVICTTMGASVDLESEGLRRLLVNACYWALGLADQIPDKSNVDYVGKYEPTFYGFGQHKPGLKPADLAK
jgi:alpha-N-arabinofuranosidase